MARTKAYYGVSIRQLMDAGLLNSGDSLTCEPRRGEVYAGHIEADGGLVLDGKKFPSPSKAASTLAGNSRDGWDSILANGRPLKAYRDEYIRQSKRVPPPSSPLQQTVTPTPPNSMSEQATPLAHGPVPLVELVKEHMRGVADELGQRIASLPADQFEELVAKVLSPMGYKDVRRVGGPGDRNIDVIGTYHPPFCEIAVRVQVKHRRNGPNIGPTDVAAFRDRAGGPDHLLLMVTNVDFTDGAKETASEHGRQLVHLVDGEQLVGAMMENNIGVKNGALGIPEIDEEFWRGFSTPA